MRYSSPAPKRPGNLLSPALPTLRVFLTLVFFGLTPSLQATAETPSPGALAAFDTYTSTLEAYLAGQHSSRKAFLPLAASPEARSLRAGQLLVDRQPSPSRVRGTGAALWDWRGTAFVPGANAAAFGALLRNIPAYPRVFAPEVLEAHLLPGTGSHLLSQMRIEQHHGLTVVLDTSYDTTFGQLDPQHAFSASHSIAVTEIAAPGTPREHPLTPAEAHGFLYRLNTYWTWEERDGGLYLQIETVSLTRAVPPALAWFLSPYLEGIPRESLTFSLRSVCNALRSEAATPSRTRPTPPPSLTLLAPPRPLPESTRPAVTQPATATR